MFQPNSIKGLLMRKEERMMDTMGSDQKMPSDKSIYDRDIQQLVETKCVIKEIDNTIRNIREWREDQQRSLERSLKMNKELAEALVNNQSSQELAAYREEQRQRQLQSIREQEQALQKLLEEQAEQASKQMTEQKRSDEAYDIVTQKLVDFDKKKEQLMSNKEAMLSDHQEAFIESVKNMNDIFKKPTASKSGGDSQPKGGSQKQRIKGELDEIDRELRELQEMLND